MEPPATRKLRTRFTVAAAAIALAATVSGCGLGAGKTPSGASLLVTQNFGAQTILQTDRPKVVGADTVMRLLERNANVATRYGGGFVESIDGRSGGSEDGQPDDWFYYVNGVQGG
jgi:ABC-type phosphate transport system substrate-binding protein